MTPDHHKKKKGGRRLQQSPAKTNRPKRTGRDLVLHRAFQVVTVLAGLIIICFLAYQLVHSMLIVKPKLPGSGEKRPPAGPVHSLAPGETEDPEAPRNEDRKSEDFYTILVVGRDTGGGGNTDVLMLVSYDVTNQKLNVMNIPRDTMVNKAWDIKKINSVYNYAGGGDEGIKALRDTVADTVGFAPDFHVIVEWEAVGRLATAVGGVEFEVPLNMYYDDPYQDLHIHISKGLQSLNGDQVMKVLRFRKNNDGTGYASGDIGRIATQQALLKAIAKKLLTPATLTKLPELVTIFSENVETDLSVNNLLWFGEAALKGGLNMDRVNFVTMPGEYNGFFYSRSTGGNESYVFPYVDEILQLVNEDFNPYKNDVTRADLDIMYKNRDGTIAATGGTVRDSQANPAYWEYINTPRDTPDPDASPDPDATGDPEDPDQTRDPEDPDQTGTPSTEPGGDEPGGEEDPGFEDDDPAGEDPQGGEDPGETDPAGTEPTGGEPDPEGPPAGIPIFE